MRQGTAVACYRAVVRDEELQRAWWSGDITDELRRRVGWLFDLSESAGVGLHQSRSAQRAQVTFAIELDAWQEAAYRGVMP